MLFRSEAWQAVGPFDERFAFYCQDMDFCLRLRDVGWSVAVVPGARVLHHGGGTIRQREGAVPGGYHPTLLWTDFLRWAAKRHSAARARRMAGWLWLGAELRVAARRLAVPCLPAERRVAWRRDTRAFEAALAAVRAWPDTPLPSRT